MDPLAKPLRRQREDAVVKARHLAEQAAQAALLDLGIGDADAPQHLTDTERALRRRLRAHGRQLGDQRAPNGAQAIEHQRALERMLANLAPETFHASDGLGWVYQFWQTKQKDRVNASEVKIGADELPAVTQSLHRALHGRLPARQQPRRLVGRAPAERRGSAQCRDGGGAAPQGRHPWCAAGVPALRPRLRSQGFQP